VACQRERLPARRNLAYAENVVHFRRVLPLFAVGAFLAVYGNAVSTVMAFPTPLGEATGLAVGILLTVIIVAWGRRAGLTRADLGLGRDRLWRSALIGLLAALVTVTPALLFLRFPPILGAPVTYGPAEFISDSALARRVLVLMPLDTAVPEELAFRGVLLGALLRNHAALPAVLLSAVPFTLWHIVIVGRTLGLTNLTVEPWFVLAGFVGAMATVFVGGVLFAWLRVATGHLAGSITAHLGFNTALLVGLRVLQTG
jgi:membrane protease YdiL (CAAX protease family)